MNAVAKAWSVAGGTRRMSEGLWAAYAADRSTENRNALVVHYLDFVSIVAKTLLRNPGNQISSLEELVSVGSVQLIKSIEKYNSATASFENFAFRQLRNGMSKSLAKTRKHQAIELHQSRIYTEDTSSALQHADELRVMYEASDCLTDKESTFLQLHYREGLTNAEAAAEMGVSKERIRQYRTAIISKLKARLAKREEGFDS